MSIWLRRKSLQISSFFRQTHTPWALTFDSLKLRPWPFVAIRQDGIRLGLEPRCGESYTFYENLLREDYLRHGVNLNPGDSVIDIGANIGSFTVLAAIKVGPKGKVYSFEPDPAVYERLLKNVEMNGLKNVHAFNYAVGGEDTTVPFRVFRKSAYNSIVSKVGDRPESAVARTFDVKVRDIRSILDEYAADTLKLLKVDCEGAEYDILKRLDPPRAARIEQVTMEEHEIPDQAQSYIRERLTELGFAVYPTYPTTAFRKAPEPAA